MTSAVYTGVPLCVGIAGGGGGLGRGGANGQRRRIAGGRDDDDEDDGESGGGGAGGAAPNRARAVILRLRVRRPNVFVMISHVLYTDSPAVAAAM